MRDSKIANEIPSHSVHGLRIKGYDIIGVNIFHFTLMRFHFKARIIQCLLYYLLARPRIFWHLIELSTI